jgi:hypothetical protein
MCFRVKGGSKEVGMDVSFMIPIFPISIENNIQKEVALSGFAGGGFGGWFFHGCIFSS